MRFFALLDFRYYVLAVFLGLISGLLIYISFRRTAEESKGDEILDRYPEGITTAEHPTPPLLLFVYIGAAVWVILYVIFFGILGPSI